MRRRLGRVGADAESGGECGDGVGEAVAGTSEQVRQLVEREVDAHGYLGVGYVGAAALDAQQVRADGALGVQQRGVAALLERGLHELDAVVGDGGELLERLLLLAERALLRVAHLVQPQHELLPARVYRVRQSGSQPTTMYFIYSCYFMSLLCILV